MQKIFIKNCLVKPLQAKLISPFRTALGQHDTLDNLAFHVELSDGTKGFGEAAVASHITGETLQATQANLAVISKELIGQEIGGYLAVSSYLDQKLTDNHCAAAAVEMALLDAFTKTLNIPLWKLFGSSLTKITSDITIVISDLDETIETAKAFYRQGFRTFKVKVGRDDALDIKRVLAVKKHTRNSPMIIDANQGYSAEQTLKFLNELKRLGVYPALIEQPVHKEDRDGLKKVTQSAGIPVCADESASNLSDVVRIIKERAAHVINIKLMKFGLVQAREAAILARAAGLDLMIGGMMESPLAMTAAAHVACGMGCFKFVDLDTPFFISTAPRIGGLRQTTFLNSKGVYDLSKVKCGIGIDL